MTMWALESGVLPAGDATLVGGKDVPTVVSWIEGQHWKPILADKQRLYGQAVAAWVAAAVSVAVGAVAGKPAIGALVGVLAGLIGLYLWDKANKLKPPRRVRSVTKVYWGALALPLEGKMALYDLAGLVEPKRLHLQLLNDPDHLKDLYDQFNAIMGKLDVFEPVGETYGFKDGTLWGVDGRLRQVLLDLRSTLEDVTAQEVVVPVIEPSNPVVEFLRQIAPKLKAVEVDPVIRSLSGAQIAELNGRIEGVYSAAREAARFDIDDVLAELQSFIDYKQTQLTVAHESGASWLDEVASLAVTTLRFPREVNFCPVCNSEDKDSPAEPTRLVCDTSTGAWHCPACHRSFEPDVRRIESRFWHEVMSPVYDQILMSLRSEILGIERETEKELISLQKEQEVKLQETRMGVEQAHRKRIADIRRFKSQANGLKAQAVGMTAALARYQKIAASLKDSFNADCLRIEGEVERRSQEALRKIEEEFQKRQSWAIGESDARVRINKVEELKRHREVMVATLTTEVDKHALAHGNHFQRKKAKENAAKAAANMTQGS